jgi:radical SAM-linked protein
MRGDAGFPIRVRYTKRAKVRFVGHRDLARAFERAFRVLDLPLAFTQGFSPRPKVSLGLALGVGHESDAEYLDLELSEPVDVEALPSALSAALPDGVDVTGAARLVPRARALQESVTLVDYRVAVTGAGGVPVAPEVLAAAVDRARTSPALLVTRTRKGRTSTDDIKRSICTIGLATAADHGAPVLELGLSTQHRGARPREVLDALSNGVVLAEHRVLRTAQWIERDGARVEPLEADALTRASPARVVEEGSNVRRHHAGDHPGSPPDRRAGRVVDQRTAW